MLTLIQGQRDARKGKLLCQISLRVMNGFEFNFAHGWDLFVWWFLFLFYHIWLVFKGENPTDVICWVGLLSVIYRLIPFKLGMMVDTTSPRSLIPMLMTLTFIKGHVIEVRHFCQTWDFFRWSANFRRLSGPTGHFWDQFKSVEKIIGYI